MEDELDPRTVRIHRMPVAFIDESVIDPNTVQQNTESARRWRAQASFDEIPMGRPASPTPVRRVNPPMYSPPLAPPEPERTNVVALLATALLGGSLGFVVLVVWGWLTR